MERSRSGGVGVAGRRVIEPRSFHGTILLTVCLAVAALMGGNCDVNVTPPPEAVLAGTWLLTGEQISTFLDKALVFNSSGRLTQITTRSTNIFGSEQRVVERDLNLNPVVNGSNVRIVLTGDLVFEGTFNDGLTEAVGKLQTETTWFNTTIITDQGPGKIVKQ